MKPVLKLILVKLELLTLRLENYMSTNTEKLAEIAAALKLNTDLALSVDQVTTAIFTEVQALVKAANVTVPGLDELLADTLANNAILTHAVATGTAIDGLVPDPSADSAVLTDAVVVEAATTATDS